MAVADPTNPWAIVLCSLEGSTGDPQVVGDMKSMFSRGKSSLFDYWNAQSSGVIDVSRSEVYGWYPSTWSMFGETTAGKTPYEGVTKGPARDYFHNHAIEVLKANNPGIDVGRFRGVFYP